jgi:NAD(P)-dependent dehydrogenase (short-subunit alcohol dehydrogenase family)
LQRRLVADREAKSSGTGDATRVSRRLRESSFEDWIADLNLKVLQAVRCTRLAVPHLVAVGGGAIVNVLSVAPRPLALRRCRRVPPVLPAWP